MPDLFDLRGRVALLTGASRGIGLAMATALAGHGATVVISARRQDRLDAAAETISGQGGKAIGIAANIDDHGQLAGLVQRTRDAAGPIDILVGNAGVNPYFGPISEIPDDAYEKTMRANVQANLWLARLVAPDMIARGSGSMMFTSSIGAFKASESLGTYGMSKLALIGLVRNLALEWGPAGIRVNAICPGLVRTEFARALWDDDERAAGIASTIPLRRLGEPEDLAGLAVFLAADASRYMTGQALTVCGGSSMWA